MYTVQVYDLCTLYRYMIMYTVQVYDYDAGSEDDFMGRTFLSVSSVLAGNLEDRFVQFFYQYQVSRALRAYLRFLLLFIAPSAAFSFPKLSNSNY